MSLQETLREEMFSAFKEGLTNKSNILKLAISSIKLAQVDKGEELTDEEVIRVIRKEVKKIEDSILEYKEMGRKDLEDIELEQKAVLEVYLPQMMNEDEILGIVKKKKEELGITDKRDIGRLMGVVMKELNGKADGTLVKDIVNQELE